MSNFIHNLHIENFKSIKNLDLECKRINVFIGKPNVGKSNILEGVGLYGIQNNRTNEDKQNGVEGILRFDELADLFYDQTLDNKIKITSEIGIANIDYFADYSEFRLAIFPRNEEKNYQESLLRETREVGIFDHYELPKHLDESSDFAAFSLNLDSERHIKGVGVSPVKLYKFKMLEQYYDHPFSSSLLPPFGLNLPAITARNQKLFSEFSMLFQEYGLQLVYSKKEQKLLVQKQVGQIVYQTPYSLTADTLQRFIFHLAAIKTNQNSILVLEEPEAHSYPEYIQRIANEIVASETNQFFLATHSPYLLLTLLENTPFEDLGVFIVDYQDYETKVKTLSKEAVSQILDHGVDIFFNLDAYLK